MTTERKLSREAPPQKEGHTLTPCLQRSLFEIADDPKAPSPYTQTIDIWDKLPRFNPVSSDCRYHVDLPTEKQIYQSEFKEKELHLKIEVVAANIPTPKRLIKKIREQLAKERKCSPENIPDKDVPVRVHVFPGVREDKVEGALLYELTRGSGTYETNKTHVEFSLYRIQKVLKEAGVNFNLTDIKEALDVLRGSQLSITNCSESKDQRNIVDNVESNFLADKETTNRKEYLEKVKNGENAYCSATFHKFVNRALSSGAFRLVNHNRRMQLNNFLARSLNKILEQNFRNAGKGQTHKISMISFISNAGIPLKEVISDMTKMMVAALKELKSKDAISDYEKETITDLNDRRKTVDVIFTIYPSQQFIEDMIKSHIRKISDNELIAIEHTNNSAANDYISA